MEYWNRPERCEVVWFSISITPTLRPVEVVKPHLTTKGI